MVSSVTIASMLKRISVSFYFYLSIAVFFDTHVVKLFLLLIENGDYFWKGTSLSECSVMNLEKSNSAE